MWSGVAIELNIYRRGMILKFKLRKDKGFTLAEIAIVVLIISLVAGSLLGPLSKQIEQRRISETQKLLEESKEALLGYAASRGYLPCPAVSATDGNEGSRDAAGRCSNLRGFLPWVSLGITRTDSWGRIFRYAVTSQFSDNDTKPAFSALGTYTIISSSSPVTNLATAVPVVILSHGPNGNGATQENGLALANTSSTNTDEQTNLTSTTTFVSRVPTENTAAPGGEFDDIVTWIPSSILFNRMVAAGQLP
jgi:prepilin-type N-terminal cleavage/methylation domain-containing protein